MAGTLVTLYDVEDRADGPNLAEMWGAKTISLLGTLSPTQGPGRQSDRAAGREGGRARLSELGSGELVVAPPGVIRSPPAAAAGSLGWGPAMATSGSGIRWF